MDARAELDPFLWRLRTQGHDPAAGEQERLNAQPRELSVVYYSGERRERSPIRKCKFIRAFLVCNNSD
jgi:hypothetical protein